MVKRTMALCGLVSLLAAVGTAQPDRDGPRPVPGLDSERLKAELGLDDAQLEALRKLHAEQRKQVIGRRAALQVARLELDELLAAETVDEKAVLAQAEQLSELQGAALRGLVKSRVALRRILSADQARAFEQLMRRPGREGRGQGPPGRGRGPRGDLPGGPGGVEPEPSGTPQGH